MASLRREIMRVVREILVPLVQADGGEIYVVSLTDEAVELHLAGRFAGGPGSTLMTRRIIEPAVWAVAPNVRVFVTSGSLVPEAAVRADRTPDTSPPDPGEGAGKTP